MGILKALGKAVKAPMKPIQKVVNKAPGMGAMNKAVGKMPGMNALGGAMGIGPSPQSAPMQQMQAPMQNMAQAGGAVGQALGGGNMERPQPMGYAPPSDNPNPFVGQQVDDQMQQDGQRQQELQAQMAQQAQQMQQAPPPQPTQSNVWDRLGQRGIQQAQPQQQRGGGGMGRAMGGAMRRMF